MEKKYKINICMGSSCFARGNEDILGIIKEFLNEHNLKGMVEFKGHLCRDLCNEGPNIEINGQMYNRVSEGNIHTILGEVFKNEID